MQADPDMYIQHVLKCLWFLVITLAVTEVAHTQCPTGATVTGNDHCLWIVWTTPPQPLPMNILEDGANHTLKNGEGTSESPAVYQSGGGNGACNSNRGPLNGAMTVNGENCEYENGMLVTVLPIELGGFESVVLNKFIRLDWFTYSEIDNQGFELQRSEDGMKWGTLVWVPGMINSSSFQSYEFIDKQPLQGDNYYRLRQVDLDGQFEYSKVIVQAFKKTSSTLIYPNPAQNFVKITGGEVVDKEFLIYDVFGQLVLEKKLSGARLDVSSLPSGQYFAVTRDLQDDHPLRFMIHR